MATGYNLTLGPLVGGLSFDDQGHYLGSIGIGEGGPVKGLSFSEYPTYTRVIRVQPIPVEPKRSGDDLAAEAEIRAKQR